MGSLFRIVLVGKVFSIYLVPTPLPSPIRPGCSRPNPASPRTPTGMVHQQLLCTEKLQFRSLQLDSYICITYHICPIPASWKHTRASSYMLCIYLLTWCKLYAIDWYWCFINIHHSRMIPPLWKIYLTIKHLLFLIAKTCIVLALVFAQLTNLAKDVSLAGRFPFPSCNDSVH